MSRPANLNILPYEALLRMAGAHLDHEDALMASLLETGDGIVVRYECAQKHGMQLSTFAPADLSNDEVARRGILSTTPGRYQDVLRALGHEFEDEKAWCILVDELADGFVVSYEKADSANGYEAVKRRVPLGTQELGTLVQQARKRRVDAPTEKKGLFSWLFS